MCQQCYKDCDEATMNFSSVDEDSVHLPPSHLESRDVASTAHINGLTRNVK